VWRGSASRAPGRASHWFLSPPTPVAAQSAAAPTAAAQPATASQEVAIHPGKVVIMIGGWGGRFAQLHGTNCHNYDVNFHGYMIRSDENRKFIPGIATAWEVSEDGHTWTVTVRDDAVFHDGQPVTAEDVEFTWLQSWGPGAINVATSSSAINMSRNVEKIEQVSPNQVSLTTINIDSGFPGFISDTSGACRAWCCPSISGMVMRFSMPTGWWLMTRTLLELGL
jgi:ABC-type transport system substrate-binding protein